MQKIVAAFLVRDEGGVDRYLERCIQNALSLCDSVVCLDDNSQDNTVEVLEGLERVKVAQRGAQDAGDGFWGRDESAARAQLWDLAAEEAEDGWILVQDADMELVGITREELLTLCNTEVCNSYSLPLWDCWHDDKHHRIGPYWSAMAHPRVWLFRAMPYPGFKPDWGKHKAIHSGHGPRNYPIVAAQMPPLVAWLHLGYIKPEARLTKYKKYIDLAEISQA